MSLFENQDAMERAIELMRQACAGLQQFEDRMGECIALLERQPGAAKFAVELMKARAALPTFKPLIERITLLVGDD